MRIDIASKRIQLKESVRSKVICQPKSNKVCLTPKYSKNVISLEKNSDFSRPVKGLLRPKRVLSRNVTGCISSNTLSGYLGLSRNDSSINISQTKQVRNTFLDYKKSENQIMKDLGSTSAPTTYHLKTHIPRPKTMTRPPSSTSNSGLYAPSTMSKADMTRPSTIPRRVNSRSVTGGVRVSKFTAPGSNISRVQSTYRRSDHNGSKNDRNQLKASDSINENGGDGTSTTDRTAKQLKSILQEKCQRYDKLKHELKEKQKVLEDLYSNMQLTQKEMSHLGQNVELPPKLDLKKDFCSSGYVSPTQPYGAKNRINRLGSKNKVSASENSINQSVLIDPKQLNKLSDGLVETCQKTLEKRKDIIDWLNHIVTSEIKGIKMKNLVCKLNEFKAENESLTKNLEKVKSDFVNDIKEAFYKNSAADIVGLQLRIEDLTYELVEQQAQNAALKKKLQMDHLKINPKKNKLEELEKEAKEEKYKNCKLKDKLLRVEIQAKGVPQLKTALCDAKTQIWELERTVQQLDEENKRIQAEFDNELGKLTESIKQNTKRLEDISKAREKLQFEKEDLENKYGELSNNYKESMNNMKQELSSNMAKVIEIEKKYNTLMEEKKKVDEKVESLLNQLFDDQRKIKELNAEVEERESDKLRCINLQTELSGTRQEVMHLQEKLQKYKDEMHQQDRTIDEIKKQIREYQLREERLKYDLNLKDDYIMELEKKQSHLEQQLQDSESKMPVYEQQLNTLRDSLTELREVFGNFENVREIREMMNDQRQQLLEANRKSNELAKALQQKEFEYSQQVEANEKQLKHFIKNEETINRLTAKEAEHYSIIDRLKNALQEKVSIDADLQDKLVNKNQEITFLQSEIGNQKQQIAELEKIINSYESKTREMGLQRQMEEEKMCELERRVAEYEFLESQKNCNRPGDNIDTLIKLLEDELDEPLCEPQMMTKTPRDLKSSKKAYVTNYMFKRNSPSDLSTIETTNNRATQDNIPTKIVMGNFVKRTYNISNDDLREDKLDRKKAIRSIDSQKYSIDSQKYNSNCDNNLNKFDKQNSSKIFSNTLSNLDKKKYNKMFKLASHRM